MIDTSDPATPDARQLPRPAQARTSALSRRARFGSAAARRWFAGGGRLTWRVFIAVAGVVAAVLVATLVLFTIAAQHTAEVASNVALDRTARLVSVLLEGRERSLARAATVFVQNPYFRSSVIQGRPDDLLDQAIEAAQRTGATWVQIVDALGVRVARSDEPTAPAVSLSGSALISNALEGRTMTGIGTTDDSLLFQTVAVPIVLDSLQVVGVLMAAQTIDSALVSEVKRATASDIVFYALDSAGAPHVAESTLGHTQALTAYLARLIGSLGDDAGAGASARVELAIDGAHFVGRSAPLRSASNEVLGGFAALRSRDAELAPFTALRRRMALAGILGLALAVGLSFVAARSVARPVLALANATEKVIEGDYSHDVTVQANDEIGMLADAVRTMLHDLREKEALVAVLRAASAGPAVGALTAGSPKPRAAATDEFEPGSTIANRYVLSDILGVGGTGVVYKAFDRELGEVVALKTVRPEVLAVDDTALQRLKDEIRLARRISHRNVVRTHDLGETGGVYFITMEYVTGTSLREILDREDGGPLPVPATLAIAKQLCRALEVAHEQGIIHRDIKPQNLMVQPDGTLKVMDFGVARLAQRTAGITQVGLVVGTPAYMAPEQLLDEPIDARTDLYAAGVVFYECLTGRRPIEAESPASLIARMLSVTPQPAHEVNPAVPEPLSDLVMRVLSREPTIRPASAGELYELLIDSELTPAA